MNGQPYTPQDNSCVCGVRIGDHRKEDLWACLDRFCKVYRKINKVWIND